jgi:UDP-GlcNAc:undecaprenyl-phosphate GlcNAc-1-phosphate transferase
MIYFFLALVLAGILTYGVRLAATKLGILDYPDNDRHRHKFPVSLWGGIGIWAAFWLVLAMAIRHQAVVGPDLSTAKIIGVFIGSTIMLVVGLMDDKWKISPRARLLVSLVAVLVVMAAGVGITKITNPFGGIWYLDFISWQFGWLQIFPVAALIVLVWIMGTTYTMKVLDGLDGLATGIAVIGALMIGLIASTERWYQPSVALMAFILAGAALGFLIWNWSPAKIYLAEGGGLFLGFMLGVLAVIAGGKFATALLVMAVPILDLAWVIMARRRRGQAVSQGDREHLHFRLIDAGFGERQVVVFYYLTAILFGLATLFLQSHEKIVILFFLIILALALELLVNRMKNLSRP